VYVQCKSNVFCAVWKTVGRVLRKAAVPMQLFLSLVGLPCHSKVRVAARGFENNVCRDLGWVD
jgi:hypothetical protein